MTKSLAILNTPSVYPTHTLLPTSSPRSAHLEMEIVGGWDLEAGAAPSSRSYNYYAE